VSRAVFPDSHVHPAIREKVAGHHRAIIDEVQGAVAAHDVVVVGMGINPFPKRACKALKAAGVAFHYLGYGSYFGDWRRRTALKMWTGWPTFPMIFVKGTFVGGATDLEALIASGELKKLLAGPRVG
jgi:monothiol glutaredoxin